MYFDPKITINYIHKITQQSVKRPRYRNRQSEVRGAYIDFFNWPVGIQSAIFVGSWLARFSINLSQNADNWTSL